jgi:outer membrane lipoprotein-sorting protein
MDDETRRVVELVSKKCESLNAFVVDYSSQMQSRMSSGQGRGRIWYQAPNLLRTEYKAGDKKTVTIQRGTKYSIYVEGENFIYEADMSEAVTRDPFLELANTPRPNAILKMINPETLQYVGTQPFVERTAYDFKGRIEREFESFGRKMKAIVDLDLQFDALTGLLMKYEAATDFS